MYAKTKITRTFKSLYQYANHFEGYLAEANAKKVAKICGTI
jgi:hypothetical protein